MENFRVCEIHKQQDSSIHRPTSKVSTQVLCFLNPCLYIIQGLQITSRANSRSGITIRLNPKLIVTYYESNINKYSIYLCSGPMGEASKKTSHVSINGYESHPDLPFLPKALKEKTADTRGKDGFGPTKDISGGIFLFCCYSFHKVQFTCSKISK